MYQQEEAGQFAYTMLESHASVFLDICDLFFEALLYVDEPSVFGITKMSVISSIGGR